MAEGVGFELVYKGMKRFTFISEQNMTPPLTPLFNLPAKLAWCWEALRDEVVVDAVLQDAAKAAGMETLVGVTRQPGQNGARSEDQSYRTLSLSILTRL